MPKYTVSLNLDPRYMYETLGKLDRLLYVFGEVEYAAEKKIEEGMRRVASKAQSYAPKRTGYMASQIQAERDKVTGHAYYTLFVELGHWTRGRKSWVPGQFFIRRAFEEEIAQIRKEVETAIMVLLRSSE